MENNESNSFKILSLNKSDKKEIIPKTENIQTSLPEFSNELDSRKNMDNITSELNEKVKENKVKRVEFNPIITVINIQSYKKENIIETNDINNNTYDIIKKCISCNVY